MEYEVFEKAIHRHKRETKLFVTIYKGTSPQIGFSLPCAMWFEKQDAKKVQYLWNSETKTMAFSPAPNGYALHIKKTQAYVSAKLFLEYIGNPLAGRYKATIDDSKKMIIVPLIDLESGSKPIQD